MNTALEQLLRPRLVLAVIVVIAATAGLLMDPTDRLRMGYRGRCCHVVDHWRGRRA